MKIENMMRRGFNLFIKNSGFLVLRFERFFSVNVVKKLDLKTVKENIHFLLVEANVYSLLLCWYTVTQQPTK